MEFKLTSPQNFVQVIEFNYDDLKLWIQKQVKKYQNLVYTDDIIKTAKEDRAALNKFRESIDAARKDVKKRYLKPYNAFEDKVKSLLALIDEPAKAIDSQVKSYETKKKEEKKTEIETYFNAAAGDLISLLTLEKIFDDKWLNATMSIKNVQSEIDKIIEKVKFDLATIKNLKSEWELTLIDTYLNTLDVAAALNEKNRLEERKAAIENQKNETEKPVEATPAEEQKEVVEIATTEKIYERKFWVKGTKAQLIKLGDYMKANGIEYGGIE